MLFSFKYTDPGACQASGLVTQSLPVVMWDTLEIQSQRQKPMGQPECLNRTLSFKFPQNYYTDHGTQPEPSPLGVLPPFSKAARNQPPLRPRLWLHGQQEVTAEGL